jgi:hypothetical protein
LYDTSNHDVNFGQRPFAYTPPAGYLKLNTFNLPDSSIVDGSENFDTVTFIQVMEHHNITGVGFLLISYGLKVEANSAYNPWIMGLLLEV